MTRIHFRYGSMPRRRFRHQKRMFGGLLGGHIYFEVNNYFYGFEPSNERTYHFFPSKIFNADFKKETLEEWAIKHKDQKVLTIGLKLSTGQESKLLEILERYHQQVPYDYAVFGMRCGASSYHILSQIGLFKEVSKTRSMLAIPYPKFLRKKLLSIAMSNGWPITRQEGTPERIWETD